MKYSKEQVEIFDKIFNYYVDYKINRTQREIPTESFLAKKFGIEKKLAHFAVEEISKSGNELELLKANKSGYGDWKINSMDDYKCKQFQEKGGFTGLYDYELSKIEEQLRKSEKEKQIADLDLQDKTFKVNWKRLPIIISILALLVSIVAPFIPQNNSTKVRVLEQRIEQMEIKIKLLEKVKLSHAQDIDSILILKKSK